MITYFIHVCVILIQTLNLLFVLQVSVLHIPETVHRHWGVVDQMNNEQENVVSGKINVT